MLNMNIQVNGIIFLVHIPQYFASKSFQANLLMYVRKVHLYCSSKSIVP